MAESILITDNNLEEAVSRAAGIIGSKEFDYFESGSEARAHADFEGVDLAELGGTPLGYTSVPRQYPDNLKANLGTLFRSLEHEPSLHFVHIDRYGVRLGHTHGGASLVVAEGEQSCSLQFNSGTVAEHSLQPKQDNDADPSLDWNKAIQLPLGRNVLREDSGAADYARAARDGFRDWERVLIVGQDAIKRYIHTCFFEKDERITNAQHAARIGQVGYLLALEQELAYDTGFRFAVADPENLHKP
jgi:hypothetical protein